MADVGGAAVDTASAVAANAAAIQMLSSTVDVLWLINGSIFVFFMQTGFAFLEAGSVRAKNTKNILLKNLIDTSLGALMWFAVGYGLSYGEGNAFIGGSNFFLIDVKQPSKELAFWLYSNAFAATSATIVSGALAERCRFQAYAFYTICITGFIYPTANHWVNGSQGWLSRMNPERSFPDSNGLLDFAGSGTVHLIGGMCSLVGCTWLGPRKGRFSTDGAVNPMPGHSTLMAAMGTMILWTGWYAFNSVSTQRAVGLMDVAALTTVNTTLCAAAGGVTSMFLSFWVHKDLDVTPCLNGILSGLVASSSICAYVHAYAALLIGILSGVAYFGASKLLLKLKVDDPLDVVPVHFVNGVLSLFMAGLFATPYGLEASGYPKFTESCGAFYGCGGRQLKVQIVGILVLGAWAFLTSSALFAPLSMFGALRVSTSQEMEGLDVTFHGGTAYNFGTNYDGKPGIHRTGTGGAVGSIETVLHASLRGGNQFGSVNEVTGPQGSFTRYQRASSKDAPARPVGKSDGTNSAGNSVVRSNAAGTALAASLPLSGTSASTELTDNSRKRSLDGLNVKTAIRSASSSAVRAQPLVTEEGVVLQDDDSTAHAAGQ